MKSNNTCIYLLPDGPLDGTVDGAKFVGAKVGIFVGAFVGTSVGTLVGFSVGPLVGYATHM